MLVKILNKWKLLICIYRFRLVVKKNVAILQSHLQRITRKFNLSTSRKERRQCFRRNAFRARGVRGEKAAVQKLQKGLGGRRVARAPRSLSLIAE